MDSYGGGGIGGAVLGSATALPATSALVLWLTNTDLTIVYGLIAVNLFSLIINFTVIVRYLQNYRRH